MILDAAFAEQIRVNNLSEKLSSFYHPRTWTRKIRIRVDGKDTAIPDSR